MRIRSLLGEGVVPGGGGGVTPLNRYAQLHMELSCMTNDKSIAEQLVVGHFQYMGNIKCKKESLGKSQILRGHFTKKGEAKNLRKKNNVRVQNLGVRGHNSELCLLMHTLHSQLISAGDAFQ